MDRVNLRIPVQIATVTEDCSIIWNTEALLHVLERANGNNIKIIIVIGRYQIGKTSFISFVTRNNLHVIGEGSDETTNGATIDGPYSIEDLVNDRNLIQEAPNNESIFFVDIEGYGGNLRGNRNQQFSFFSRLCVPFVGISSCIVFLCDTNEDRTSLDQVLTALNLNCFRINNGYFSSCVVLVNLLRNVRRYRGTSYAHPNNDNYMTLSDLLTTHWQREKFQNVDFDVSMFSKPLPLYETDSYNFGLNLILRDLVDILINTNVRYETNNPNRICSFFTSLCNITDNFHRTFIHRETLNFYIQLIEDSIQPILNHQNQEILASIYRFSDMIKTDPNYTNLSQLHISNDIRVEALFNLEQCIIDQNIGENYLQIPEIIDFINNFRAGFETLILSKTNEIISFKIREMLNSHLIAIEQNLELYATQMRNRACDDLNHVNIVNILRQIINLNEYFHDNIPEETLALSFVNPIINEYRNSVEQIIDSKAKEMIIDKVIYYRARLIAHIDLKINEITVKLRKANLLKYIPDNETFVFACFEHLLIDKSDQLFDEYLRDKNVLDMEEIIEIRNVMHDEIINDIRSIMPDLMSSLEKKKKFQVFLKILIGIGIAIPTGGIIASGIGAGVLASVAAAAAAGAAATAGAAGAAASLFLSSSALLANVVIKYPEFRDLLNDKEMAHILEIFDVINFDFQKIQEEIYEMENEELRQRNRMNIDDGNDNFEDEINLNDIPFET